MIRIPNICPALDTHPNQRAMSTGNLTRAPIAYMRVTLWERGFPFCSEIIAEASKLGMKIVEVGITYRKRVGKTKLNPLTVGASIFWASVKMLRDYDPLFLFGEIGLLLEAVGFVSLGL